MCLKQTFTMFVYITYHKHQMKDDDNVIDLHVTLQMFHSGRYTGMSQLVLK